MNLVQAKSIPIRVLLAALGYQPAHMDDRNGELWYRSPFREEAQPSFKLTPSGKGWYDHGLGKGGGIIDFCMDYWRTDIGGAY
jgi:hypothetical protein